MYTTEDVEKAWFAVGITNRALSEGRTTTEIIGQASAPTGDPPEWHQRFAAGQAILQTTNIIISPERYNHMPSSHEKDRFIQAHPDLISDILTMDINETGLPEYFFIGLVKKS